MTLRSQTRLGAGAARRVARRARAIGLDHVAGAPASCPMDDGSAAVIALSYPKRADVDLWVNLTGCRGVANGRIGAPLATLPLPSP
jgi:hypothetical protein